MKKFLFFLMSAVLLVGFVACENKDKADSEDLEITEKNIIGKWEMTTIESGGQKVPGGGQVWEFCKDHTMVITDAEGYLVENAGSWELDGEELNIEFLPIPATVEELTSKKMVLVGRMYGQEAFKYTFKKKK